MSRITRRWTALGLLTVAGVALAAAPASASPGRQQLRGSTPGWLHGARNLGATPSSQQVGFGVLLAMRNQAGAEAQLQAISDPSSPSYGQWLSNAAFDSTSAPAASDVSAVQAWL